MDAILQLSSDPRLAWQIEEIAPDSDFIRFEPPAKVSISDRSLVL